ncbi:MAG: hypothetical protein FWC57_00620 [Endomicrobia bacterium]|nr:hypothetical protein [Endomicrobiia bacterium]
MALTENQLAEAVSNSKTGRYEMVKLALEWIEVNKYNEDYRKLTQADLIAQALDDVVEGIATSDKIEELRKKMKARENKEAAAAPAPAAASGEKA